MKIKSTNTNDHALCELVSKPWETVCFVQQNKGRCDAVQPSEERELIVGHLLLHVLGVSLLESYFIVLVQQQYVVAPVVGHLHLHRHPFVHRHEE